MGQKKSGAHIKKRREDFKSSSSCSSFVRAPETKAKGVPSPLFSSYKK